MANSTLNVTQALDDPEKHIRLVDNADTTYSIAVSALSSALPSGASTSANQVLELSELRSMNVLSSVVWDSVVITYTDATKAVVQKVEWKLGAAVVKTFTPTFAATTDTWVKT